MVGALIVEDGEIVASQAMKSLGGSRSEVALVAAASANGGPSEASARALGKRKVVQKCDIKFN